MKKIINLILVGAAMSALVTSAFAQTAGPRNGGGAPQGGQRGPGGPGGQRGEMMQRMRKMQEEVMAKLNLTPQQKTKIKSLNDKFQDDMKKLRDGVKQGERPTDAQREKMRDLSTKHREAIQAVLTPKQKEQYEKLMKEAMEKMRKERGQGGAGGQRPGGGRPGQGGGNKPPKN